MFLKFVKSKKNTYVYLMEYVPVEERSEVDYKDRRVVRRLGDLNEALLIIEIWKRHPQKIPGNIINYIEKDDLKKWLNLIIDQDDFFKFLYADVRWI